MDNNINVEKYSTDTTNNIYNDVKQIVESSRQYAYNAVNVAMVQRNWLLGKRIADEELKGEDRAAYGKEIVKKLSEYLTELYGKGFTKSNLY